MPNQIRRASPSYQVSPVKKGGMTIEGPQAGRLEGSYRVEGWSLRRTSDDLTLVVCWNPNPAGRTYADRFFVEVTPAGRKRVGFLYGSGPDLVGREFDDRRHRYRVVFVSPGVVRIRTLWEKGHRKGRSRG